MLLARQATSEIARLDLDVSPAKADDQEKVQVEQEMDAAKKEFASTAAEKSKAEAAPKQAAD